MPVANGADGTTTTALSPPRIELAVPLVFDLCRTHVLSGPLGPVSVADAVVTVEGIIAINGRPTVWPPHPQNVRGSGDSAMNRVIEVVAPLPGNTTGVDGLGVPQRFPRTTSSVAAERHWVLVGFGGLEHRPNAACCSEGRRMPIAWNGPDIHRSMCPRAVAEGLLDTATLPLLPAWSPSAV